MLPPTAALSYGRLLYSRTASAVRRHSNRALTMHARWCLLGTVAVFVMAAASRHILAQARLLVHLLLIEATF